MPEIIEREMPEFRSESDVEERVIEHVINRMLSELNLVSARLLGTDPELSAAIGRLQTEASFRTSIIPPLVGLFAVFLVGLGGFTISVGLLVGFFILLGLHLQGSESERDANELVVDALTIGRANSPTLERLEVAVERERTR